jgi:1,2-dihydroxy-3-keto-5-methylthiopentene dioxygenase
MAKVFNRQTGKGLKDQKSVSSFLGDQGVIYERWGIERLPSRLRSEYRLKDEEKGELIDLFRDEIGELKRSQNYQTEDIVVLSEKTPDLEGVLEKFRKEHHHIDDEVRFTIDGSGIFSIHQGELTFDITVEPGDLVVVPAYTRHWFNLNEEQRIKCIRIFKDPAGWEAVYD